MTLLFGLPAGAAWITIMMFFVIPWVIIPISAIVLYIKNRDLKNQFKILTEENRKLRAGN